MSVYTGKAKWLMLAALFCAAVGRLSAETRQYSYDSMQRLTRVTYGNGTVVNYVYDNLGNRLMKTATLTGSPSNQPPAAVTNPSIVSGTTNVTVTPNLSWHAAVDPNPGDVVVYYVYLGPSPTPPLAFSGSSTNWSPASLQGLTTYYWYVVARDSQNVQSTSPAWSFTTGFVPPVANFTASPLSGFAPLTVNFTDQSSCSDDSIVSWAWDFNNDGVIDSTVQSPSYTYTSIGNYTVRLSVQGSHAGTGTITKTNFISVFGTNTVDLVPTSLTVNSATSLDGLLVQYSIKNQGTINVSALLSYADVFYISTSPVLDESAIQVATFYEDQPLPPGSSYSRTQAVSILGWGQYVSEGYGYLILKPDAYNQISAINESNNVMAISLNGRLPDLVPESFSWTGSASAGGPIQVAYTAANKGAIALNAQWHDVVYLSTTTVLDNAVGLGGVFPVTEVLPIGGSYSSSNTVTLPGVPPGNYYLILDIDGDDEIVESNETDKTVAIPITLGVADLAPVSIVSTNTNLQSPTVVVDWGVTNQGSGVAYGIWLDEIYVSTNTSLSGQIGAPTYVSLAGSLVPVGGKYTLPVGGVYTGSTTVTLPQQSGTYYLIYVANAYQTLFETNYANNVLASGPVTLTYSGPPPPDLAPVSVVPTSTNVGFISYSGCSQSPTVVVNWEVTNLGLGVASGYWYDFIYVSTNMSTNGLVAETFADGQFEPLPVGGVYTGSTAVTLPQQSGAYYLIYVANVGQTLYEANYANNQLASEPVTVAGPLPPADLVPVSVVPATTNVVFYSGSPEPPTVLVNWGVTNLGPGVAWGSWSDKIFISTNTSLSGSVGFGTTSAGSQAGPFPVGGVYTGNTTVTLPQQSGTYYLIFDANVGQTLCETDYTNNLLASRPVTVTVIPPCSPPAFEILSIKRQGNNILLTWNSPAGTNIVQASNGGVKGSYSNNFTDIPASLVVIPGCGGTTNYVVGGGATNSLARYYRIRMVAPSVTPPAFEILSLHLEDDNVLITWSSPGGTNIVQVTNGGLKGSYSNNFADIPGSLTIIPSVGGTTNYMDIDGATNSPARYYRIRTGP